MVPAPGEQGVWPRFSIVYFVRPESQCILGRLEGEGVPPLKEGEEEEPEEDAKRPDYARGEVLLESSDEEDDKGEESDTGGVVTLGFIPVAGYKLLPRFDLAIRSKILNGTEQLHDGILCNPPVPLDQNQYNWGWTCAVRQSLSPPQQSFED